jgi:phage gp46-like protein
VIAVFHDNTLLCGDIAYAKGQIVNAGFDLETAAYLSLALDAPAQPGDVLPHGTPKSGYWADVFFPGIITGSRLWLLRNGIPDEAHARLAVTYADEALRWMVQAKHFRKTVAQTELKSKAIWLGIDLYLPLGNTPKHLGPMKVT